MTDHLDYEKDGIIKVIIGHECEEEIDVSKVARYSTIGNVAMFFHRFLNTMTRDGFRSGEAVGSILKTTHRTLQRSFICWCIGALCGMAEQENSDARNEQALESAQKISKMVEEGELNMGAFI